MNNHITCIAKKQTSSKFLVICKSVGIVLLNSNKLATKYMPTKKVIGIKKNMFLPSLKHFL